MEISDEIGAEEIIQLALRSRAGSLDSRCWVRGFASICRL